MRTLILAAALTLIAGAASARSHHPQEATLCLDQLGGSHPPVCHSLEASRISQAPDICQCRGPWRQVSAPYCAPGERPQAESAAFEHARARASRDGSLFGDSFQGRSMCVPLR